MMSVDQIEAADMLLEAFGERQVGEDVSTRDLIEALGSRGLVLATGVGGQVETIHRLDEMDAA